MLKDISPPITEPISLTETKLFLRVDGQDEDSLIETLIQSARERLETHLGVAMITRAMQISVPPQSCVRLPRWPVNSVDSVLIDGDAAQNFETNLRARPSSVVLTGHPRIEDGIDIVFTAGFGPSAFDVPTPLRQAMLLLVSHAFEHRDVLDAPMPLMVDALTGPYRMASL